MDKPVMNLVTLTERESRVVWEALTEFFDKYNHIMNPVDVTALRHKFFMENGQ